MKSLPFVFSNERNWRIVRHVVFWLLWFVFQLFLYSFSPNPVLRDLNLLKRLALTAPESLIFLIPQFFLAYGLMYWVIPVYVLRGKYAFATVVSVLLFLTTAGISALLSITIIDEIREAYLKHIYHDHYKYQPMPLYVQFGLAMMGGLRGSITVGGIAAAIKLMKCFYEKEQAALVLEREKISAELQMLKAQLHPHFLFNTLNNIYSFTQEVSAVASEMIFGLSELLRYMLYECNQSYVSLDKELKMINDYIALEKARYGNNLDISINVPTTKTNLRIAPVLLLPLLENCFKHGASKMITNPWISMDLRINDCMLDLKLVNGKAPGNGPNLGGIGLTNTRKRLDLIYEGLYDLKALDEDDMYIVNLKITLDYLPLPEKSPLINKRQHTAP